MNRREGFKAMNAKVIVLLKRDLNYKLKLASNEDSEKRFEFFWALAKEKTQMRHNLPPLLCRILCVPLLFVDDLFSVCFLELFVFPSHVARNSPFYLYLLFVLFRVPPAVFRLFQRPF